MLKLRVQRAVRPAGVSPGGVFFLVMPVISDIDRPPPHPPVGAWRRRVVQLVLSLGLGASLFGLSGLVAQPAWALTAEEAYAISAGDGDDRVAALRAGGAPGGPPPPPPLPAPARAPPHRGGGPRHHL